MERVLTGFIAEVIIRINYAFTIARVSLVPGVELR
jgi:hypothetical protein